MHVLHKGVITTPEKPVAIPGYDFLDSCSTVDFLLPMLLQDDAPECQLLQSMSTYCGCPAPEDSCSLCRNGHPVMELEKQVHWLAQAFQGTVPSCGLVEAYAASKSLNDSTCSSLQAVSSYCGCAPIEDHCVYCPGEILQEEFKDVEFPKLSDEAMGITGTCELYFLTQYQLSKDDELCDLSMMATFHCGCNNGVLPYYGASTQQQHQVTSWLPRGVAFILLFASICVLRDISKCNKKRHNVYHQLVFLIVCFDIVTSLVWIVGPAAIESFHEKVGLQWGINGALGNKSTCRARGFFFQLGFTSVFLSLSLTIYYLLVIVYSYREEKLKRIRLWLFVPPLLLGCGLAFAVIPFVDVGWSSCQFDVYPRAETFWILLLFGLIPILGSTFAILVILVNIYFKVRAQMNRESIWRFSRQRLPSIALQRSSAIRSTRQGLERAVFFQCISYACAFCVSWPILSIAEIEAANFDFPYWFWVVVCITAPLQGLNNAICYFRSFKQRKGWHPNDRLSPAGGRSRLVGAASMPDNASSFFMRRIQKHSSYLRPSLLRSSVLDAMSSSGGDKELDFQ